MTGHHAAKKGTTFTGARLALETRYDGKANGNCNHNNHNFFHVDF
jgi:hypothetical protein